MWVLRQPRSIAVAAWISTRFQPGVTAAKLVAAVSANPRFLAWLAFYKVRGSPRYGTHCVGIPRQGAALACHLCDDDAEKATLDGKPLSYLKGLDTFIHELQHRTVKGSPAAVAASVSLATQIRHKFQCRN